MHAPNNKQDMQFRNWVPLPLSWQHFRQRRFGAILHFCLAWWMHANKIIMQLPSARERAIPPIFVTLHFPNLLAVNPGLKRVPTTLGYDLAGRTECKFNGRENQAFFVSKMQVDFFLLDELFRSVMRSSLNFPCFVIWHFFERRKRRRTFEK